jgi:hypothetical protein
VPLVVSTPPKDPGLPAKGAAEEERHSSMAIFFVLCVVGKRKKKEETIFTFISSTQNQSR